MSNFSFRKWASRLWEHSTITNKEEEKEEGELVCVICTNGKVASEPVKSEGDNVFIALCTGCKDWAEFMPENLIEEINNE